MRENLIFLLAIIELNSFYPLLAARVGLDLSISAVCLPTCEC